MDRTNNIVRFLMNHGWIQDSVGERFIFFKAPASVGLPKDYTLPIPRSGEFMNSELEKVARLISEIYEVEEDSIFLEGEDYLKSLLKNAIFFKMSSENERFGKTLEVNEIWDFLKNLSTSYSNYVKINFLKKFGSLYESDSQKINIVSNRFLKFSNLRLVALEYRSFSFGVSVDRIMGRNEIESKPIIEWRENLINEFNDKVLGIDYSSEKVLTDLFESDESEEARLIYYPILRSVNNNSKYSISITNNEFVPKRTFGRVNKKIIQNLVKRQTEEMDEEVKTTFIRTVLPVDNSKSEIRLKVSDLEGESLFTQHYNEISEKFTEFNSKKFGLIKLTKDVDFTVTSNIKTGKYIVSLTNLGYQFNLDTLTYIQKAFDNFLETKIEEIINGSDSNSMVILELKKFLTEILPEKVIE